MKNQISNFTTCRTLLAAALLAGAAGSPLAMAQGITAPEPIKQDGRYMPGFAGDTIARVRYTVKADGTTTDIEVTPVMANAMLGNMLKQNVQKWTFKPATLNGNPIEIRNQEALLVSRMDPDAPRPQVAPGKAARAGTPQPKPGEGAAKPGEGGAPVFDPAKMLTYKLVMSEGVSKTLTEVGELSKNKEYDKALSEVNAAINKGQHLVLDYAALNQTASVLHTAKNEQFEALESLGQATLYAIGPNGEKAFMLDDMNLEKALRQKVALAVTLRHHAQAQEAFALLKEKFIVLPDDKINDIVKASSTMMASPDPLALLGKLPEKGEWTYPLSRRVFTLADVKGKIDNITARCERKDQKLKYQDNQDWALPASWGKCVLDFEGKEGTTFTLYESNAQQ